MLDGRRMMDRQPRTVQELRWSSLLSSSTIDEREVWSAPRVDANAGCAGCVGERRNLSHACRTDEEGYLSAGTIARCLYNDAAITRMFIHRDNYFPTTTIAASADGGSERSGEFWRRLYHRRSGHPKLERRLEVGALRGQRGGGGGERVPRC